MNNFQNNDFEVSSLISIGIIIVILIKEILRNPKILCVDSTHVEKPSRPKSILRRTHKKYLSKKRLGKKSPS